MPDTGKDRWNSLLETLGVPASEPTPQRSSEVPVEESSAAPAKPQPISMLRPEKAKPAAKPKPTKPPAKSPSYWSRIAGALGLESATQPEPPVEPAVEPAQEAPVAESSETSFTRQDETRRSRPSREEEKPRGFDRPRREQPRRDEPRHEQPRREESRREEPRHREERDEAVPSSRQPLNEMFGKKEPDVNVFALGLDDEEANSPRSRASEPPSSMPQESGAVLDYDRPEGADLSFKQPPAERGFGDEEGDERDGRRRRRRRGRGRGRGRGSEQAPHATERHESDIEPAGEDADFDIDRDEDLDIEADLGDQPVGRERGPRGADEPRDRGADDYPPRGERPSRHREERSERGRDDDRRGDRSRRGRSERSAPGRPERDDARPPRRPARLTTPADDEPDEDLQAAGMDDDDSGDGGSPTHKRIPTWDEAVNLLIDANMAARANSPDRGDRGRGRGRGRGR